MKPFLYYANMILLIISVVLFFYFGIQILIDPDNWFLWIKRLVFAVVGQGVFWLLFIIRKNRYPAPGKDYF